MDKNKTFETNKQPDVKIKFLGHREFNKNIS